MRKLFFVLLAAVTLTALLAGPASAAFMIY